MRRPFHGFAFVLFLRFVILYAVDAAKTQPTATPQQLKLDDRNAIHGRRDSNEDAKYASSTVESHSGEYENEILFDSTTKQLHKITSTHLVRLEFSGVSYASMSLSVVKDDLIDVIEDVLTTHLENGIEVIGVKMIDNRRKLRHTATRKLSYIMLVVRISLRHSTWISSERALDSTIEILSEYVDKDFQNYMRDLPGNGDYLGTVDVREAYEEFSIVIPSTVRPISSPTQMMAGVFQFNLVFTGVSSDLADSVVLRNYIHFGITKVLNDGLNSNNKLVDVSLQPWQPEAELIFPIIITLHSTMDPDVAFADVDYVLSRNIGDLDLYLNDYLAVSSLSSMEKIRLELAMEGVFGELDSVEINKETPNPTRRPTQAPTKFFKPANDWLNNATADTMDDVPWWGWLILGVGLSLFAVCCCCCISQFFKYKHAPRGREHVAAPNVIQVRESNTNYATDHPQTMHTEYVPSESIYATRPNRFRESKNPREEDVIQNPGLFAYKPNPNAPDPDEDNKKIKRQKKKKKKKKKHKKPRDQGSFATSWLGYSRES